MMDQGNSSGCPAPEIVTRADIDAAREYLGLGIQSWGQTAAQRESATRKYVEAAGKRFGTPDADKWLQGVVGNLRRGKFETEVEQLAHALSAAKANL